MKSVAIQQQTTSSSNWQRSLYFNQIIIFLETKQNGMI